jgi:hypothetical protein
MTLAMTLFGFAFVWGVFEKALGVPFPRASSSCGWG